MKLWYYLVQFTWGILQNLAGCFWFLCCLRKKHSIYHGAILTRVRMKRFSAVAKSNGTTLEAVQKRYAAKIREKIPAGSWYQDDAGKWQKKK